VLGGLFIAPAVTAVTEALASASADRRLAVIGDAKLATALAAAKHDVVPVGLSIRAAKKLAAALPDLSTIDDHSLSAVVGVDVATDDRWDVALREWSRVVRDGGVLVLVDKGHAPEASRRALCAGLSELEQRRVGRVVVTSGLVTHFVGDS
jgi:hypothetical protein